jgi:hypothetical protein
MIQGNTLFGMAYFTHWYGTIIIIFAVSEKYTGI